jgi:hypothetical protein
MTQSTRYVSYDSNRPQVAVGVKIDTTNPDPGASVTRIFYDKYGEYAEGTAVNSIFNVNTASSPYVSTFDTFDADTNHATGGTGLMPWCGMKRSMVGVSSDIDSVHGDIDDYGNSIYTDSSGYGKIFVNVPKFWYKFYKSGNYKYYLISPYPMKGFRLFPAFNRAYKPIDYIMIGAYEGYLSNGIYYSGTNNTPTTNTSRATARAAANLLGYGQGGGLLQRFELIDLQAWVMLQWLYLIEFAHLNCQIPSGSTARGGLSPGIGIPTTTKQLTGWTGSYTMTSGNYHNVDLGNSSGQVQIGAGPNYAMSYRGVENLWGNTWTQLDANIVDTSRYLWVRYNQPGSDGAWNALVDYTTAQLADPYTNVGVYQQTAMLTPAATGNISSMFYDAAYHEAEWFPFMPSTVTGTPTTYWCGQYSYLSSAVERYFIVGGSYDNGSQNSIFSVNNTMSITQPYASVGSRLMLTPYFIRDTKFYTY